MNISPKSPPKSKASVSDILMSNYEEDMNEATDYRNSELYKKYLPFPDAPIGVPKSTPRYASLDENNLLDNYVINDYIKLLANGERAREELGKFITVPAEFFGLLSLAYGLFKKNKARQNEYLDTLKKDYASKIENLLDYDNVIIPANVGEHWALFIVKPKDGLIMAYDSDNTKLAEYANYLKNFIKLMGVKKTFHLDYYKGPRQKNKYDCGAFLLEFLRWLMYEGEGQFTQKDMPRIRQRIKQELNAKRLQPHFEYGK